MTNQPDIIDFARKCASGSTVRIKQVELGQALLIAVEALEKSAKFCGINCRGHDVQTDESLCAGCPAVKALSKIRSLPSA